MSSQHWSVWGSSWSRRETGPLPILASGLPKVVRASLGKRWWGLHLPVLLPGRHLVPSAVVPCLSSGLCGKGWRHPLTLRLRSQVCGIRWGREPTGTPLLRDPLSLPGGCEAGRMMVNTRTTVEGLWFLQFLLCTVGREAVGDGVEVASSIPSV